LNYHIDDKTPEERAREHRNSFINEHKSDIDHHLSNCIKNTEELDEIIRSKLKVAWNNGFDYWRKEIKFNDGDMNCKKEVTKICFHLNYIEYDGTFQAFIKLLRPDDELRFSVRTNNNQYVEQSVDPEGGCIFNVKELNTNQIYYWRVWVEDTNKVRVYKNIPHWNFKVLAVTGSGNGNIGTLSLSALSFPAAATTKLPASRACSTDSFNALENLPTIQLAFMTLAPIRRA